MKATFWVLAFLCLAYGRLEAQTDTTMPNNAYELCVQLGKVYAGQFVPDRKQALRLLGALEWYEDIRNGTDTVFQKSRYKLLDAVEQRLISLVASSILFYKSSASQVNTALALKKVKREIVAEVLKLHREYDTSIGQFKNADSVWVYKKQKCLSDLSKRDSMQAEWDTLQDISPDKLTVLQKGSIYRDTTFLKSDTIHLDSLAVSRSIRIREAAREDTVDVVKRCNDYLAIHTAILWPALVYLSGNTIADDMTDRTSLASATFKASALTGSYLIYRDNPSGVTAGGINIGSFETESLDAVAIFLADRIKQESIMFFFQEITRYIKQFDLIRQFFPNTCALLESREVYEIPNMGTQWRYALSKDFCSMPRNVLNSDWLRQRWPEVNQYRSFLIGACDLAELIIKHYTYADAIKTLYLKSPELRSDGIQFHDYVSLLYAFNTELMVKGTAKTYRPLSFEDLELMSHEELEIMLSLVDLRYKGVFTKFIVAMDKDFSVKGSKDEEDIKRWIGNIEIAVGEIGKATDDFEKDQTDKSKQATGTSGFYTSYNVWEAMDELLHLFQDSTNRVLKIGTVENEKVLGYIDMVHEMYGQIINKNFSGAVQGALSLIDTLLYSRLNRLTTMSLADIKKNNGAGGGRSSYLNSVFKNAHDSSGHIHLSTVDSTALSKIGASFKTDSILFAKSSPIAGLILERDRHAIEVVKKLSGFLNDAALAKTDKQLATVFQSYALPPGSYQRKRNTWWSLDLNAFAGPYVGREWVINNPRLNQPSKQPAWVYGFSTPIGISLSKTLGARVKSYSDENADYMKNPDQVKLKKKGIYKRTQWTFTLTASVVDIGAIVSFRLTHTSDTVLPHNFNWSQFISPGLHLASDIPGTPLVLMAGIEYSPKIRTFKDDSAYAAVPGKAYSNAYNTYRAYFGVMFDIPIFNLWERRRIVY